MTRIRHAGFRQVADRTQGTGKERHFVPTLYFNSEGVLSQGHLYKSHYVWATVIIDYSILQSYDQLLWSEAAICSGC